MGWVNAMRYRFQFDGKTDLASMSHCGAKRLSSGKGEPQIWPKERFRHDNAAPPTRFHIWLPLVAACLLVCAVPAGAQHSGGYTAAQTAGPTNVHNVDGTHEPEFPDPNSRGQEQMADRRNTERQRQLIADTEKLFQLAQQLRDEVAKSNKDQLSIPVVKRSEEIEKLARSVKEKMRGY